MSKKHQILLLNYEFPPLGGGGSPVSYEITDELSKTGQFDIDVVTMGYKNLPKYEEINPSFRIHRVPCLRSKKEICQPWEQATYLISGFFKSWQLINKKRYDLCYTHFIIPTGFLALIIKFLFKLEYVITSHGSDVLGYNPRFKKLYPFLKYPWKKILDNAKTITSPTNFLKTEIQKVHPDLDQNKIIVIPNGITAGKFVPLPKEKYILLVGRLTINKGFQDFIEAIKDLDLKDWQVKIVGEGPYRSILEKMVKDYRLENKVNFLGWIDNKDPLLHELYGKAAIFVLPSWFENMNVTLMEALQAGCDVLASDVGGNPEVTDQNNLFPAKNPPALRAKLISKLAKINFHLPSNTRFNWENIISQFVEIFK
ncbi:MAG: glycosyltransferase family 4 protein [Patescibacteria group bacterium]